MILEATVLDKIHTGLVHHERTRDDTSKKELCVLGETEDNAACNSYLTVFSHSFMATISFTAIFWPVIVGGCHGPFGGGLVVVCLP